VRRTSLPPCSEVLADIPSVLTAPGFGAALADSGQRLAVGLLIALAVGVSLGAVMGRQRIVQRLVEPLVVVAFPIPKAALALLFVPWWGAGSVTRVGIVVTGALVPIVVAAFHSAHDLDARVLWAARSLGAGPLTRGLRVVLPSTLPQLVPAFRLALGVAIFTVIGSELLIRGEGVGAFLFTALDNGQTATVFATTTIVAVIGVVLDVTYRVVIERRLRWLEVAR
jgi:NitT/TauT family transport system permease protein